MAWVRLFWVVFAARHVVGVAWIVGLSRCDLRWRIQVVQFSLPLWPCELLRITFDCLLTNMG